LDTASISSKYLMGPLMKREQQSSRNSRTSDDGADDPGDAPRLAVKASKASGEVLVCSISWSWRITLRRDLIPAYSSVSWDVTSSLRSVTKGECGRVSSKLAVD
jgi:hypothetical protein